MAEYVYRRPFRRQLDRRWLPAAVPNADVTVGLSGVAATCAAGLLGVALAVGVMGVAAGMLMSTRTTLDTECPGKVCTQAGLDALSKGQTLNVVGSVGFGVGVAGLAGFLTWLAWPSSRRPVGSARTPLAVASW